MAFQRSVSPVFLFSLTLVLASAGCAPSQDGGEPVAEPAGYLFAWAGDQDERPEDTNFLAVIDIDPASPTYREIVATSPLGSAGGMPHHTEVELPRDGQPLFVNAFMAGRTWLYDLRDPLAPAMVGEVDSVPGYHMPHSFLRLADGTVLATMQFGHASAEGQPGGLARFSPEGRLLAVTSSADPAFAGERIRTYALDASAAIDRVVTTSSPMDTEVTAHVVQLWRLSDLQLLATIAVPEAPADTAWQYPFEVRFIEDGRTAVMSTFYCGFYLLSDLDTDAPAIERVLALGYPPYSWCGVPLVIGRFWIMPVERAAEVVVLDLGDPRAPTIVTRLTADSGFTPHWAARDRGSDRVVLPSFDEDDPRVLIARFDSTTGSLVWDETFRDPRDGRLGIAFTRESWPHGDTGPAMPHGVLFSRGGR